MVDGVAGEREGGPLCDSRFNLVLLGIICDRFRNPAGIKRPFADIGVGRGNRGGGEK